MDTFIIHDRQGNAVTNAETIAQIETELRRSLKSKTVHQGSHNVRKSRHLKVFDHPTRINFQQDYINSRTVMEISALDMPGLLSVIANVIADQGIDIIHAKISTLGEKIDDIFYLTDKNGGALTDPNALALLEQSLIDALEARKAA